MTASPLRGLSVVLGLTVVLPACGAHAERTPPPATSQAVARPTLPPPSQGGQGGGKHASGTPPEKGRPAAADHVKAEVTPGSGTAGPGSRGDASIPGTATLRADRVAVIIGIDDYPGEDTDLVAAVSDARVVRRALVRMGFGRIVFLLNGEATRDAILWSARWLARQSGPGTVGAFFYAGHVRQAAGDPDGDGEEIDEAIAGSDDRLLYDGDLARALDGASGPLWLAFASCFAAGFSDAAGPGRVSSYASGEESLAYESASLGHSFMVEYLVRRAMLENGLTSVERAHAHAWRAMRGDVRRFRPLMDDRLHGRLELGPSPPPGGPGPGTQACLVVLRCGG